MKLLVKTNRIYLAFSLIIYLLTALAFYHIVRLLIYDDVESRLQIERRDFETYVRIHNSWTSSPYFVENKIDIVPVSQHTRQLTQTRGVFTDTLIRNRYDDELIPFRQLTFYVPIQGTIHRVSIRKSLIQTYRLIEAVTFTMATFLGLLLLGTFWFQGKLSGRLWHPFYETLSRIRHFNLNSVTPLRLSKPEINEFNELNEVLQKMADKMQHDYQSLKEFTENASHEMQTPLALINAKVEQLIQSEQLTETQTNWIGTIYEASRRIVRLNQGLLLLAKIENNQFQDAQLINLTQLFQEKLQDMDDVLSFKKLTVHYHQLTPFDVKLPLTLADIFVTNLVNNAIKHNHSGGSIKLDSSTDYLSLSNTGGHLVSDPNRLFERFKKEATGTDSIGLGLSIVKQICDSYGLKVTYKETNGLHQFYITRLLLTDSNN
ncbi:sensor histidine kinase [Spirosoma agri]|uniref:histidine kinase n=1 Tax=Spirosoma agri TaxID=1987381 RepID=A0A6M0IH25_9BACT|nr:histidine kinase dimerization/phospho-acceptor domain-containing protein [Spirosoma agri]NEU67177.1 sensor histidine kinase [Spirosoma agri]